MDEFANPLLDVPVELHDLMPPYLNLAKKSGRVIIEQAITLHPLPWREDTCSWIISACLKEFHTLIRDELPDLPEVVVTAMCRQLISAVADRIDEIWSARSGDTGGRA